MRFKLVFKLLVGVLVIYAANVQAGIVTFGVGEPIEENGYIEAGMSISATAATTDPSFMRIRDWQSYRRNSNSNFGERELLGGNPDLSNYEGDIFVFSLLSGGMFDLLSIDVQDPAGTGSHWSTIGSAEIVGSNGSTVALDAEDFGTHSFGTTFFGISGFTIHYPDRAQVTFDNVRFRIPEPTTGCLIASSILSLNFARRRSGDRAVNFLILENGG